MKVSQDSKANIKIGSYTIFKAQILGALIGFIGTVGFTILCEITSKPQHGQPQLSILGLIQILIAVPTYQICKLFNYQFDLSNSHTEFDSIKIDSLILMGVVNGILLFLVGTIIGYLIATLRKFRR